MPDDLNASAARLLRFDNTAIGPHILPAIRKGSVTVIGDIILDHYVTGDVQRVSPEAPVPVVHVLSEHWVAGGAANVAANVASLGGRVELIGVTGQDQGARQLAGLLEGYCGLKPSLIATPTRPTAVKTRYMGGQQQIVRIDREDNTAFPPDVQRALLDKIAHALNQTSLLVVSDYAKGLFSRDFTAQVISLGVEAGIPILVDPKQRDLSYYAGATVITPNRKELFEATGLVCDTDAEVEEAAAKAIAQSGADILLTRSEQGMSYVSQRSATVHMPTEAREVFDVSGAGDTVVAAFGLALAAGLSVPQAMQISNLAAGIAVARHGTAAVPYEAVARKLWQAEADPALFEIFENVDDLAQRCQDWKRDGLSVGFANGCFDLIHPGHIRLIQEAAHACDKLVMALNSDASVRRLKGPTRPLQDEAARAEVMAAIKGVDAVTFFDDDTPMALIEKLVPDVIIKGADYTEDQVVGGEFVKSKGGRVHLVTLKDGHSTTILAKKSKQS